MSSYKLSVDITKYHEGKLSKNLNDNASKNPVPDGSGYHTNKGVTWSTFVGLAPVLKYKATPELFYSMPDVVFNAIFEHFWNKAGANLIDDQPVANLLFQVLWGSGPTGFKIFVKDIQYYLNKEKQYGLTVDGSLGIKTASACNAMASQSFLETLVGFRIAYLKTLSDWPSFGKGWSNRYKDMVILSKQWYLNLPDEKKVVTKIAGFGSLGLVLFLLFASSDD